MDAPFFSFHRNQLAAGTLMGELAVLPKALKLGDLAVIVIRELGTQAVAHTVLVHAAKDNAALIITLQ